jgi:hypothetical protein
VARVRERHRLEGEPAASRAVAAPRTAFDRLARERGVHPDRDRPRRVEPLDAEPGDGEVVGQVDREPAHTEAEEGAAVSPSIP